MGTHFKQSNLELFHPFCKTNNVISWKGVGSIDELEYLMNPALYEKWRISTESNSSGDFNNDLKFYKKRIVQLTKDMSKGTTTSQSLKIAFNEYAKVCISYLKTIDRKDILQKEYDGLVIQSNDSLDSHNLEEATNEELNNTLINPAYTHSKTTLHDYLNIKTVSNKEKQPMSLPKEKNIQLNKLYN